MEWIGMEARLRLPAHSPVHSLRVIKRMHNEAQLKFPPCNCKCRPIFLDLQCFDLFLLIATPPPTTVFLSQCMHGICEELLTRHSKAFAGKHCPDISLASASAWWAHGGKGNPLESVVKVEDDWIVEAFSHPAAMKGSNRRQVLPCGQSCAPARKAAGTALQIKLKCKHERTPQNLKTVRMSWSHCFLLVPQHGTALGLSSCPSHWSLSSFNQASQWAGSIGPGQPAHIQQQVAEYGRRS
eukprot:1156036-Pelagomonas_calceolata.AAC.4